MAAVRDYEIDWYCVASGGVGPDDYHQDIESAYSADDALTQFRLRAGPHARVERIGPRVGVGPGKTTRSNE